MENSYSQEDPNESSPHQHPDDSQFAGEEASGEEGYYQEQDGEHDGEDFEEGDEEQEEDEDHGGEEDDFEGNGDLEEGDVIMVQHSRRIKRDIIESLNKVRKDKSLGKLYTDLFSTLIANDYAEFLKSNEHDPDIFKQLSEEYNVFGDLKIVYTVSKFEEDANIAETFHQDFLDLGHLLLEVESDRKVLLDANVNHIGVGVSLTPENLILVEVFSSKVVCVTKISDGEDGGIEIRGKMLTDQKGLYAVKLQNMEDKKEQLIGPENIEFDKNTKDFIAIIDTDESIGSSHKFIEFYVRVKPETIEYKRASKEKLNLKHLELAHRCPCMIFPDPRYLAQDEQDRARRENEALEKMRIEDEKRMRKEEERRERKDRRKNLRQEIEDRRARGEEIESLASSTQRSDRSFLSKNFGQRGLESKDSELLENKSHLSPDRSIGDPDKSDLGSLRKGDNYDPDQVEEGDSKSEEEEDLGMDSRGPMISNKDIKDELELAIEEAQRQLKKEEDRNFFLQQLILQLKEKNDLHLEKQNEIPMTEPKYLNTLAHVHQIRLDLKQTQDRYNDMARELQVKLDEKQAKCFEIRKAFMDLKKEVCKKAAYSRTDKPIPERLIFDWEDKENDKSKELQLLRLENLRLRNHLAKNQKVLKKKEELAEGLHLIDYEQLKIENQTLNEKIEERNEDLHKLKKKNTNTVQILTHFKEKLQFVIQENEKLKVEGEEKEDDLKGLRKNLNDLKETRQSLKDQNQKLRQQTGIMNSKYLSRDFEGLKDVLKNERTEATYLEQKHKYMLELVGEYNKRIGKGSR